MDYYREYIETIDLLVNSFVDNYHSYLYANEISVVKPVKNHLCLLLMLNGSREVYNKLRIAEIAQNEAMYQIAELYLENYKPNTNDSLSLIISQKDEVYEYLEEYQGCTVVFCINASQLNLWKPILSSLHTKILIFCNFEQKEEVILEGDITLLELCNIPERIITNSFLERCFPLVYEYANLFAILIRVIMPSQVLVMEGCHTDVILIQCFLLQKQRQLLSFCKRPLLFLIMNI